MFNLTSNSSFAAISSTSLEALEARRFLAGDVAFLSDMEPTFVRNGMGPMEVDSSVGGRQAGDGATMSVGGTTFQQGLGVASNADVRYALNGDFVRFQATIGIDDEVGDRGMVRFQVFADGQKIYQSGKVTGASDPIDLDLDVTGAQQLRLVVHNAGQGKKFDHADFADARVTSATTTTNNNTTVTQADDMVGDMGDQSNVNDDLKNDILGDSNDTGLR